MLLPCLPTDLENLAIFKKFQGEFENLYSLFLNGIALFIVGAKSRLPMEYIVISSLRLFTRS